MEEMTIYHNPDCGTSRNALALIRASGVTPTVVEYLKTPLNHGQLLDLVAFVDLPVRDLVRERGTPFNELGLGRPSTTDDDLLDAMVANPILLNRPIVKTEDRAMLCRPSDIILDLLPSRPQGNLDREGGTPFLADHLIDVGAELEEAMAQAFLRVDDLAGPDRAYYRYSRLDGEVVGYGGFELHGEDAVLRSMAVTERFHGRGNGRNLALILMSRAFARGARTAYLCPSGDVRAFFDKLGFVEADRGKAPAAIAAVRPDPEGDRSASLLRRRIAL